MNAIGCSLILEKAKQIPFLKKTTLDKSLS